MRRIINNDWKRITDADYIAGLKTGNDHVTQSFFYGLCDFLLNDIKYSLMGGKVDYDELVNELFIYMSKDEWHKLDTFAGINGCSLVTWVTRITWRYFFKQRCRLDYNPCIDVCTEDINVSVNDHLDLEISMDVSATFEGMANKRNVKVLKWLLVEGYAPEEVAVKLNTTVSNVYNIKHRAIVQFVEIYNAC